MTVALLALDNVSIRFGGLTALDAVSISLNHGEILSLIGPNGAGKSTVFNLVTGIYPPSAGKISLDGASIGGLPPHRISAMGVGRTFQNIRLFRGLTVLDNVLVGGHSRGSCGLFGALFKFLPHVRREEGSLLELARIALSRTGLAHRAFEQADVLPYGEQRRLEIARALAMQPGVLLLDEPAAGMNHAEKKELLEMVKAIRDSGVTVFLVEHDMRFVMGISDRVVVLDHGLKIAEGTPEEVRNSPAVIEAYLGKGQASRGMEQGKCLH